MIFLYKNGTCRVTPDMKTIHKSRLKKVKYILIDVGYKHYPVYLIFTPKNIIRHIDHCRIQYRLIHTEITSIDEDYQEYLTKDVYEVSINTIETLYQYLYSFIRLDSAIDLLSGSTYYETGLVASIDVHDCILDIKTNKFNIYKSFEYEDVKNDIFESYGDITPINPMSTTISEYIKDKLIDSIEMDKNGYFRLTKGRWKYEKRNKIYDSIYMTKHEYLIYTMNQYNNIGVNFYTHNLFIYVFEISINFIICDKDIDSTSYVTNLKDISEEEFDDIYLSLSLYINYITSSQYEQIILLYSLLEYILDINRLLISIKPGERKVMIKTCISYMHMEDDDDYKYFFTELSDNNTRYIRQFRHNIISDLREGVY